VRARPPIQRVTPTPLKVAIPERQVRWRVVAHDTNVPGFAGRGDVLEVGARCGKDAIAEQIRENERAENEGG